MGAVESDLLEHVGTHRTQLEALADQHQRDRRLSDEAVNILRELDVLRAYVPAAYGGPEYSPLDTISAIQQLSRADGAVGWCATIASLTSHLSGSLTPSTAQAVFGNTNSVVCGAYAPNGTGVVQPDGSYEVTGRWAWGSGSSFAQWMTAGTICDDGTTRHMLLPRADLAIHDTWDSIGLRGTASHDFSADAILVHRDHSIDMAKPSVQVDSAVARMPMFVLFSGGVASVMLGVAQRALDELSVLADVRRPVGSSKTLNQSPVAQTDRARAEAMVNSARSYLHDTVGQAWDRVIAGDRVDHEVRLQARLAGSFAGEQAVAAVDLCYKAGGGSAVYANSPLQRCFRDVHTAAAHVMVSARTYETVGRKRFGLPIDHTTL
jgi:indole-3-acetate monooxygenase